MKIKDLKTKNDLSQPSTLSPGFNIAQRGMRQYEISNHLGNSLSRHLSWMLTTISDRRSMVTTNTGVIINYEAEIITASVPIKNCVYFAKQITTYSTSGYPFYRDSLFLSQKNNRSPNPECSVTKFREVVAMERRSYSVSAKYRYGFNGKEKDPEGMGGGGSTYDYGFRIYNPAICKFLSVDPLTKSYPWYTPYQFAGNKVIIAIDLDGLEEFIVIVQKVAGETEITKTSVYKVFSDSRKVDANNQGQGTCGVQYVYKDENGNITGTERLSDFKANSVEQMYVNESVTYYTDMNCTVQVEGPTTRRDAMVGIRPLSNYDVPDGTSAVPVRETTISNGQVRTITHNEQKKFISSETLANGGIRYKQYAGTKNIVSAEVQVNFNTDKTGFNSTDVTNFDEASRKLNKLASLVNNENQLLKNKDIKVYGSYDIRPSKYKNGCGNPCLGEDRAKSVMDYLKSKVTTIPPPSFSSQGVQNNSTTMNHSDRKATVAFIPKQ